MAANMTGMQVEGTTIIGTSQKRTHGRTPRKAGYGLAVAVLVVMLIGGIALHNRQASHPAAPTINPVQVPSVAPLPVYTQLSDGRWIVTQVRDDGTVQTDFIGVPSSESVTRTQQRFLENNTTNLPNAVTAQARPVVSSAQEKFIDVNTAWLPAVVAEIAPLAMTSSQRRLLEVNTTMMSGEGPSYPYAEELTPLPGHRR